MIYLEKAYIKDTEALTKVQLRASSNDVKICGGGPPRYDSMDKQISLMKSHIYYKMALLQQMVEKSNKLLH